MNAISLDAYACAAQKERKKEKKERKHTAAQCPLPAAETRRDTTIQSAFRHELQQQGILPEKDLGGLMLSCMDRLTRKRACDQGQAGQREQV